MELGRIKDQLERVQNELDVTDPSSEKYKTLLERQEQIRKVILDEEKRREKGAIEREKNSRELELREYEIRDRTKDRIVRALLGLGTIGVGILGIYSDEFRADCKIGLEKIDKITRVKF